MLLWSSRHSYRESLILERDGGRYIRDLGVKNTLAQLADEDVVEFIRVADVLPLTSNIYKRRRRVLRAEYCIHPDIGAE